MNLEESASYKLQRATTHFDIAQAITESGAIVCGGGVRDLYLGRIPKDLDVFIDTNIRNEWYAYFRNCGFSQIRRCFRKGDVILDTVTTIKKKSPIEIVEGFDCDVCKWYMLDAPTPLNEDVRKATDNLIATFDIKMDLFGTSPIRSKKLENSGWSVRWIMR